MPESSDAKDIVEIVEGIAKAVPIYEDAIQPVAKQVGKALETVGKTVNMALAPVSALVWGYEQIQDFVNIKVTEKLKNVPPEQIITPKPNVAGPALESLRYTGHEESLQDLYANLLAASMDARVADGVLPSFSEIVKQLTADEARLLKIFSGNRPYPLLDLRLDYKNQTESSRGGQFVAQNVNLLGQEAGCQNLNQVPVYLDNLCRLGIIEFPPMYEYTAPNVYDALENLPQITIWKLRHENDATWQPNIIRKGLAVTQMGMAFHKACVLSPDERNKI